MEKIKVMKFGKSFEKNLVTKKEFLNLFKGVYLSEEPKKSSDVVLGFFISQGDAYTSQDNYYFYCSKKRRGQLKRNIGNFIFKDGWGNFKDLENNRYFAE